MLSYKNDNCDSVFILACSEGVYDIFDIFLMSSKCTEKVLCVTDDFGKNCLFFTIGFGIISNILKLLDHHAVTDNIILATDNDGDNILTYLSNFENDTYLHFFKHPKIQDNLHTLLQSTNNSWHPCLYI